MRTIEALHSLATISATYADDPEACRPRAIVLANDATTDAQGMDELSTNKTPQRDTVAGVALRSESVSISNR